MKIKKISFVQHPVLGGHTVVFGETVIPTISFLVGDNGAGKTLVLENIYRIFSNSWNVDYDFEIVVTIVFSSSEQGQFSNGTEEVEYIVKRENGGGTSSYNATTGPIPATDINSIAKVVFSTIEVNFEQNTINSVTSKNIDDSEKPREKSKNLSVDIPQLLVDIHNLDNNDISEWYKANKVTGHTAPFPELGLRLNRFINAFHKIFGGSKTFHDIGNSDNSKKITFLDNLNNEVGLNDLSTGEKQIIYRIGYILKNLGNIHDGLILIDEPEISLHPTWQIKLKDFLFELFDGYDVQIIIATHSPFIFKNLDELKESCIKLDRSNPVSEKISMIFPNVPYNPSVQLINYLAYGIISELLHIELYTLLQIREHRDKITNSWNRSTNSANADGIENWLQDPNGGAMPIKQIFTRTGQTNPTSETIMTWIRNKLHHSDEINRPNYSEVDLKESIDLMIGLLK